MMFIVFNPGTSRSFISFVPMYSPLNVFVPHCGSQSGTGRTQPFSIIAGLYLYHCSSSGSLNQ